MTSKEHFDLRSSVASLQTGLMGFDQRVDGDYTHEERMKCQAFIVFAHAEVENYLEKVARRIMKEAQVRWNSSFFPDRVIASLLAFRRKEIVGPPDDIKNPVKSRDIKEIVRESIKLQEAVISDNNGIKQYNLSQLLLPLGLSESDVDDVLLIQLTNIGSKRGDFVHQPSKVALPRLRDPFADELSDITTLVEELGRFDLRLETIGLLSAVQHLPAADPASSVVAVSPAQ